MNYRRKDSDGKSEPISKKDADEKRGNQDDSRWGRDGKNKA